MRFKMLFMNIRNLLLLNLFVFVCWCFLLFSNCKSRKDDCKEKAKSLEEMKVRLNKINQELKNRYSNKLGFIDENLDKEIPTIYAITPTYARWTQKADLTRLAQTLSHVFKFHWIVVEDSDHKTKLVENFLQQCGIPFTHLNIKTNPNYKLKPNDPNWLLPRGVDQRNSGLTWIRKHVSKASSGVVYFLDDDNTYSLKVFEEMRRTAGGSVWPVGLSGGLKFEGPGKCKNGHVLSWYTMWKPERAFPLDMAGFAVNMKLIFKYPDALFSNQVPRGYLESHFLTSLHLSRADVEAKANDCTEILVWHTRTEKPVLKQEIKLIKQGKPSNPLIEV